MVAGPVDAEGGRTLHARDRAVEDHRATIVQQRQRFLHGEERSLDVDIVEEFVEMLFSEFAEKAKIRDPGIGEEDVKLPLA